MKGYEALAGRPIGDDVIVTALIECGRAPEQSSHFQQRVVVQGRGANLYEEARSHSNCAYNEGSSSIIARSDGDVTLRKSLLTLGYDRNHVAYLQQGRGGSNHQQMRWP